MGAPILILPSISYFASLLGPFAILIWIFSVIQGLLQNVTYAELATTFPNASGIPGYTQAILGRKNSGKIANLLGGLGAWGYLLGWSFVVSIFTLQISAYLQKLLPDLSVLSEPYLSLIVGAFIYSLLFVINYRGLGNSARLAYVLALVSLIPLIIITLAPFINGTFKLSNITGIGLPVSWHWDALHIMLIFGIFGLAEWSACASEAAAVYGPEYKNPRTDAVKSLFICGAICVFTCVIVQTSATGTLGVPGILADALSPLFPLAQASLGPIGVYLTIILLVAAMVLLIQMSALAASRALHSMAMEGNLPGILGQTNKHGTPVIALIIVFILNEALILVKSPEGLLAASAFGYMLAHGLTLYSYVKAKKDRELAALERPFQAPHGWKWIALFYAVFTLPFCFVGLMVLNGVNLGWTSTFIGLGALAVYLPLRLLARQK